MEINKLQVTVWYFVLAFVAVVLLQDMFSARRHTETFTHSEVEALLQAGKLSDVVVTDKAITGRLATGGLDGLLPPERLTSIRAMSGEDHYFATVKADDPDRLVSTVLSWVVPILLFLALWSFLMKRMGRAQGMREIGKSKAKAYAEEQIGVTFDEAAAIDEAKAELMEVAELLNILDPALRRSGRFDRHVALDPPDPSSRERILLMEKQSGEHKQVLVSS